MFITNELAQRLAFDEGTQNPKVLSENFLPEKLRYLNSWPVESEIKMLLWALISMKKQLVRIKPV